MPPFTFVGTLRLTEDQKKSKKKFHKNSDFRFNFITHAGTVEENT